MRMDHFEQGLRGKVQQIIEGYTYDNFQEMYQKAVKIARIMNESKLRKEKRTK